VHSKKSLIGLIVVMVGLIIALPFSNTVEASIKDRIKSETNKQSENKNAAIDLNKVEETSKNFSADTFINKLTESSVPIAITGLVIIAFLLFIGIWFKAIRKFTMFFFIGTLLMFILVNFKEEVMGIILAIAGEIMGLLTGD